MLTTDQNQDQETSGDVTEEIEGRLEVSRPYFALDGIHWRNDGLHPHAQKNHHSVLRAHFVPEQQLGGEMGPVCGAELGRHLAILGSAALTLTQNDDRSHYYLATRATFRRSDSLVQPASGPLLIEAMPANLGKRSAQAATRWVTDDDVQLASLDVDYQLIPQAMFERMFSTHKVQFNASPDCYRETRELEIVARTQDLISTAPRTIVAAHCAGHFAEYPCMPVAVLMGDLLRLVTAYLETQTEPAFRKYIVRTAEVSADRLAFAGDQVCFSARLLETNDTKQSFQCAATDLEGQQFGSLKVEIEHVDA